MSLVSFRIPNPNPVIEKFVDRTYEWLEELRVDYERCMQKPFEGGSGVLLASDVLVALHGERADWALWDVNAFERFVRTRVPSFVPFLPDLLADILCFVNLHTRRERIPVDAYLATQARMFAVCGTKPAPRSSRIRRRKRKPRRR